MKTIRLILIVGVLAAAAASLSAGGAEESSIVTEPSTDGAPLTVGIAAGEEFMHRFQVMPLISVKNHPQMVLWCETPDGRFLRTLFITERIATATWRAAPADKTPAEEIRRAESLPVWTHRQTEVAGLPTRESPMPDAVTGATPRESFVLRTRLPEGHKVVRLFFEVNSSTDFNEAYAKDARAGSPGYSGGPWGSGQPAVVFSALVDTETASAEPVRLELTGRASADGTSGAIFEDLSGMTTALDIIEALYVTIESSPRRLSAAR